MLPQASALLTMLETFAPFFAALARALHILPHGAFTRLANRIQPALRMGRGRRPAWSGCKCCTLIPGNGMHHCHGL